MPIDNYVHHLYILLNVKFDIKLFHSFIHHFARVLKSTRSDMFYRLAEGQKYGLKISLYLKNKSR